MLPPVCFTMPYTVERPRPVPRPAGFVVKKGSKIRDFVFSSMPHPVSVTASITYSPGITETCCAAYASSSVALLVSIVTVPPSGIASRALIARFMMTCSIWFGSAREGGGAPRRLANLFEILELPRVAVQLRRQEIRVADDRGQDVVEVVRDAA